MQSASLCTRACPWLGPRFSFPHLSWPHGPIIASRSFRSDDRPSIPGEQNLVSTHSKRNPSHILFLLPHILLCCPEQERASVQRRLRAARHESKQKGNSVVVSPFAGTSTHRWVDAPPSSGITVAPSMLALLQISEQWQLNGKDQTAYRCPMSDYHHDGSWALRRRPFFYPHDSTGHTSSIDAWSAIMAVRELATTTVQSLPVWHVDLATTDSGGHRGSNLRWVPRYPSSISVLFISFYHLPWHISATLTWLWYHC
jgi:hypothetical protein